MRDSPVVRSVGVIVLLRVIHLQQQQQQQAFRICHSATQEDAAYAEHQHVLLLLATVGETPQGHTGSLFMNNKADIFLLCPTAAKIDGCYT